MNTPTNTSIELANTLIEKYRVQEFVYSRMCSEWKSVDASDLATLIDTALAAERAENTRLRVVANLAKEKLLHNTGCRVIDDILENDHLYTARELNLARALRAALAAMETDSGDTLQSTQ